jgi:hypothetical protein
VGAVPSIATVVRDGGGDSNILLHATRPIESTFDSP